MTAPQPLSGIRVIDLTRIYSGPYATFLLAMAGAEIIKVEPPEGDSLRHRAVKGSPNLPFAMLNANKRAITLNLKTKAGKALLLRLVETADVLVDNYRPGVMERLGLGPAQLKEANPRLVYASTSGFGNDGPYRNYAAMDLTIQAISGVMESTGFPDQPPVKAGAALADFFAGVHLYGAVVTALLHRERHGAPISPEIAMLDTVYPSLSSCLGLAMDQGAGYVARTGNRHGGLSLCPYNVYPAADGHIAIICNRNAHWQGLVKVLGRDDLAQDARFAEMAGRVRHMDLIDAEISRETIRFKKEELFGHLNAQGIPSGPVRTLPELMRDPQLRQSGMLHEIDHPEFGHMVVPQSPIRYTETARVPYESSHGLGADTASVLGELLGIDAQELAGLLADGVV